MSIAPPILLDGPAALRALARAFAQFDQFDRFVGGLQAALERAPAFEQVRIRLNRDLAEGTERFRAAGLAVPLLGDTPLGALQVGSNGERRQFGAEDLHLLAGLADFLGAVLTQAQRLQDAARSRELLRLLLNQAPVGIAAYGCDRRPLVANESAIRWLGAAALPFDEIETGQEGFHLRSGGKLIYGEARRVNDVPGGAWVVVLQDLTPEQGRLLEGMEREVFRARAEGGHCAVALVESLDQRNGALRRLPAVRALLRQGEQAGPYDANRVGLVLADRGLALRTRLRKMREIFAGLPELRLGYAELERDGREPALLLQAALQRWGRYDELLRPCLLVQEGNPGVAATLVMVLGRQFKVVTSASAEQTREQLATERFEGFIAELEPRNGPGGAEMVRLAQSLQPGIRTFLTTIQPVGVEALAGTDAVVIEKPFDVARLTALVQARMAE
ncbi:MAG: hypothetical protein NDI75_01275 [Candidatus Didemnitutus sp.]|nr:hypothetical protein [Candidatus Didemnitutus sp.]